MRQQNVVLFSSGITEQNGILKYLEQELRQKGYSCVFWRDLFSGARDSQNIALLPMLIKKIPSFDFAVLIGQGHDSTLMLRNGTMESVAAMRDNVLFEIGLCTMALGNKRTILLTDGIVHLPDDLQGVGKETAVKTLHYLPEDVKSYSRAEREIDAHFRQQSPETIRQAAGDINDYIRKMHQILSPTMIGASVSTASGYISNFVLQCLEGIDKGVLLSIGYEGELRVFSEDKIWMHVILPVEYYEDTPRRG